MKQFPDPRSQRLEELHHRVEPPRVLRISPEIKVLYVILIIDTPVSKIYTSTARLLRDPHFR
ncbi:MAG: hypothetical protein M3Y08_08915 [Fibrobacterota bacterium]|nr:hypothetical protein [Fibrobacterota bacterium]